MEKQDFLTHAPKYGVDEKAYEYAFDGSGKLNISKDWDTDEEWTQHFTFQIAKRYKKWQLQ